MRRLSLTFLIIAAVCFPHILMASGNSNSFADTSRHHHTDTTHFPQEEQAKAPWLVKNRESNNPTPVVPQKRSILKETQEIIESLSSLQYKYAMMLNVNVESLKNTALLGFMDDWFGTKYRYGGTSKKGIDCSALMENLLSKVYGLMVPRTAREQYKAAEKIKTSDLKEGDLVFFKTRGKRGYVSHVGLYLDNGYFLHASSSHGVTISNLNETYFATRFIGGGRVAEK